MLEYGRNVQNGIKTILNHFRNTQARSFTGEYLGKIVRTGGKVVQKRITVPAVGYMAYWTDTEGNVLGIMQAHEKTK